MKAIILLAVCILCGESKLESEFTGASSPSIHSVIGTAVRYKRQTQEPQDEVCSANELSLREFAIDCNPKYAIGQRVVDIFLSCNHFQTGEDRVADAQRLVESCSRNANGQFCYEFEVGQTFSNYTKSALSNCSYKNSYSNYECPNMCRDALRNIQLNLGCCVNYVQNILRNTAGSSPYIFNAGLWSACSLSLPSSCQTSTLALGPVKRHCSGAEEFYTKIYCDAQIFQPILNIYKQCESPQYQGFISNCGLNENNQFCALLINETYPWAVQSQCQDYTQGCTRSCQTAINTFKTAMGCCVNVYNDSDLSSYFSTTNPALWSACGIPTPGFCPSTLVPETNSAFTYDLPKISMMLILSVLLNMHV